MDGGNHRAVRVQDQRDPRSRKALRLCPELAHESCWEHTLHGRSIDAGFLKHGSPLEHACPAATFLNVLPEVLVESTLTVDLLQAPTELVLEAVEKLADWLLETDCPSVVHLFDR